MAEAHIKEFRSTVEAVIQKQVDDAGTSWPDMHTTASAGGLTFGSYTRSDRRPHTFSVSARQGGWPEHVWGVSFEGWCRADGVNNLGLLAVVSTVERPDSLVRQWCFGRVVSIDTIREIDTPETLAAINSYIRSPHLSSEAVIGQIAILSAEELASVQEREAELAKSQDELRKNLEAIDEAERRAAESARNIYLR